MTSNRLSKASFSISGFFRQQIMLLHSRLWVVALAVLVGILRYVIIPGFVLMAIRLSETQQGGYSGGSARLVKWIGSWFGYSAFGNLFGVGFLAAVIAIQGFSYLYSMQSADFFDSQPLSFKRQFFLRYLNGIFLYAGVNLAGVAAGILVCVAGGIQSTGLFAVMLLEFLRGVVLFIGDYSIMVLAAVLSGNVITAVLLGAFLSYLEPVLKVLQYLCRSAYYSTFYNDTFFDHLYLYTSPTAYYFLGIHGDKMASTDSEALAALSLADPLRALWISLPEMGAILVLAAVASAAAVWAYCVRPRESAGRGLCFPPLESMVKIVIAGGMGMIGAVICDELCGSKYRYSVLLVLIVALAVALTCMIGEVIFSLNVARAFHRAWQIPAVTVGCLLIIVCYKQDVFGYDSRVPDPKKVESASFFPTGGSALSGGGDTEVIALPGDEHYMTLAELCEKHMEIRDIDAVNRIVKVGLREQRRYVQDQSEGAISCRVCYRMKSGEKRIRVLAIPFDIDPKDMDAVVGNRDYTETYFDTDLLRESVPQLLETYKGKFSVLYSDRPDDESEDQPIKPENLDKLLAAYEKDVREKYSYSYAKDAEVEGNITLRYVPNWKLGDAKDYQSQQQYFVVYRDYENTIAVLKKLKLYREFRPVPKEIKTMEVNAIAAEQDLEGESEEGPDMDQRMYWDQASIRAVLKNASYTNSPAEDYADWKNDEETQDYYYIRAVREKVKKSEDLDNEENMQIYEFVLDKADAPEFLVLDFD